MEKAASFVPSLAMVARAVTAAELPLTSALTNAPQLRDVQRRGFGQPDMTVNARAFIRPCFLKRGIHPHGHDIVAAIIQVISQVVIETFVTAGFPAQIKTINPDDGITEDSIEFEADFFAEIGIGNGERFAIPAHAVLREIPANRLVAVASGAPAVKRQFHRPIVRQVQGAPGPVVKIRGRRANSIAGLGEIIIVVERNGVEILARIGGVAESKAPSGVH